MEKTQLLYNFDNVLVLLTFTRGELQSCWESQGLQAGEVWEKNVILHDIGGVARIRVLVDGDLIVEGDLAWQFGLVDKGNTVR